MRSVDFGIPALCLARQISDLSRSGCMSQSEHNVYAILQLTFANIVVHMIALVACRCT